MYFRRVKSTACHVCIPLVGLKAETLRCRNFSASADWPPRKKDMLIGLNNNSLYLVSLRVVSDDKLEQTFILRFDDVFDEQLYDISSAVFKTWSNSMTNSVSSEEIFSQKIIVHEIPYKMLKYFFSFCDPYMCSWQYPFLILVGVCTSRY